MKLIVTRPQHDVITRYLSYWADEIIELAQSKGINVIDLKREKANKNELEGRVRKLKPAGIFLNGHGDSKSVTGHDNNLLIEYGVNHDILAGAITYALSCDSGNTLGKNVVENSNTTYIGYKDKFIFIADARYISKPLEDPNAKPFMESSNQVMLSLIKGHTAEQASEKAKSKFKDAYTKLLASTSGLDFMQAAQALWWNMRNLVCLGDQRKILYRTE